MPNRSNPAEMGHPSLRSPPEDPAVRIDIVHWLDIDVIPEGMSNTTDMIAADML